MQYNILRRDKRKWRGITYLLPNFYRGGSPKPKDQRDGGDAIPMLKTTRFFQQQSVARQAWKT